jgi:predicted DNA-binding transcriptional regulator AlpA
LKTKKMPDGSVRYYENGFRVTEKGERFHPAPCFRKAPKHINPHELIDSPALATEMCAEAKQAALLVMSAATVAIAASGLAVEASAAAPGVDDRLLDVKEAARRLGVSTGWLYRSADKLPFTKRLGPGQLRFSAAGIACWIREKAAA